MATSAALAFTLCLLVFFNGCLANRQWQQNNECQLNQLQAREPDNQFKSEGGLTESWDPNHQDFQCAGVAMVRRTIEQNGLHLPSYVNAPQLIYVVRGRGVLGAVFPGCPETFEESQDEQQQQQQYELPFLRLRRQGQQQQQDQQQDRHQKVRHIREGDVIALPAGVAHWTYNQGNEPLQTVALLDLSNNHNQLDNQPRRFYLAGKPQDEFDQSQQGRQQQRTGQQQQQSQRGQEELGQQSRRGQQGRRHSGQQQKGNGNGNVYSGFDTQLLAQALNVKEETARKLQGQDDNRNDIIRVQGQLDFVSPMSRSSGRQGQRQREREEEEYEKEREQQRRGGRDYDNGLEETFCNRKLSENLNDPSRADYYNPQAGYVTLLNRNHLPILRYLRLSAEKGVLYNNALYTPSWNLNANKMCYVIRGSARVQVVNENGEALLDDEVKEGQVFLVPQNHAVLLQADNQGFEYISFKTADQALTNALAGRTSVLRALPQEVLQNMYQVSEQEARNIKYNRQETRLLSASSSSSRRMSILEVILG